MIDHICLNVRDLDRAREFYAIALAPLGYVVLQQWPEAVGLGDRGKPDFWLTRQPELHAGVHIAFACRSRAMVREFHASALSAGGSDNGAPSLRDYHPHYFAAFIHDFDGNSVEAVCHQPEG